MWSFDMRRRFFEKYRGDIQDPILKTILDTIDTYNYDLQNDLLLTASDILDDDISDGFYEIFVKHLFGQLYPGPIYTVAQAKLMDARSSNAFKLEKYHHFSMQDLQGNNVFFSPIKECWIVPSFTNDIGITTSGNDLVLILNILKDNLDNEGFAYIYFDSNDNLLIERLKYRIFRLSGYYEPFYQSESSFGGVFPLISDFKSDFYQTPYLTKFIKIPVSYLKRLNYGDDSNSIILTIEGFAKYSRAFEKKLTLNCFPLWNLIQKEQILSSINDKNLYFLNDTNNAKFETFIKKVADTANQNEIEYFSQKDIVNPLYPYQYSTIYNNERNGILLSLNPQPAGNIKVEYLQYDTTENSDELSKGRSLTLYMGLDEIISNMQTIVNASRNIISKNKKHIWDYFTNMIASRNRFLTKEDIRVGIISYPLFAGNKIVADKSEIEFEEKVGRIKGSISTYTEISVPVQIPDLLISPEKDFFEREIGLYLKSKTVTGHFLRVKFINKK